MVSWLWGMGITWAIKQTILIHWNYWHGYY